MVSWLFCDYVDCERWVFSDPRRVISSSLFLFSRKRAVRCSRLCALCACFLVLRATKFPIGTGVTRIIDCASRSKLLVFFTYGTVRSVLRTSLTMLLLSHNPLTTKCEELSIQLLLLAFQSIEWRTDCIEEAEGTLDCKNKSEAPFIRITQVASIRVFQRQARFLFWTQDTHLTTLLWRAWGDSHNSNRLIFTFS